jgi:hypothetical protein
MDNQPPPGGRDDSLGAQLGERCHDRIARGPDQARELFL